MCVRGRGNIVQDVCEERALSDNAGGCVVDTCEIMRTASVKSNIPRSGRCISCAVLSNFGSGRCITCAVLSNFENVPILFMNDLIIILVYYYISTIFSFCSWKELINMDILLDIILVSHFR